MTPAHSLVERTRVEPTRVESSRTDAYRQAWLEDAALRRTEQDRDTLATLRQIGFPVQWVGCIEGGGDSPSTVNARRPSASEGFGRGKIGVGTVQPSDLDTRPTPPGFPPYTPTGDVSPVRLPAI